MDSIDPYKILELPKQYSLEQLKTNYKRLVYKHHPDKTVDVATTPAFQLLTACYKSLLKQYEASKSDKTFDELKQGSSSHYKAMQPRVNIDLDVKERFDLEKFNKVFDKVKVSDVYETGYKDWFSNEKFRSEKDRSLIKYKEPMAAVVGGADYFELGKNNASDWSGENISARSLHFTDCKTAYLTEKLVDERTVKKRKEYTSVDDLKRDREKVSYTMTEKQQRALAKRKVKEEEEERRRLKALEKYDELVEKRHMMSNKLMLSQ